MKLHTTGREKGTSEMLEIPGYTITSIVYQDSHLLVVYARSERTGKTMLLKVVKEGVRTTIENAKLIHEYHFLKDLNMDGLLRPVSYTLPKTMMVLEFHPIHAITAREYVRRHGASPLKLIQMLDRAAYRLHELHSHGILHLNIRPDTLLIQESSQDVYLTGFGYAARQEQLEPNGYGSLEGNPVYMSPEQTGRMAHQLDARADIYSLGMTFYELLCQRLPFAAQDALQWAHAHLTLKPEPFHDVNIPLWIAELIMKMLEKDPDDRYSSMKDIMESIKQNQLAVENKITTSLYKDDATNQVSSESILVQPPQQAFALKTMQKTDQALGGAGSMPLSGHIANYPQVLELAAVVQASHIFTMETEMKRVAESFMQLLVMNAGAHCGFMLMQQDGTWHVVTEAEFDGRQMKTAFRNKPLESAHRINRHLLYQSAETKGVVYGPAAAQGEGFIESKANVPSRTPKGSVLYLPVITQEQLLGVLYLENEMTAKAFVPERFPVLRNIASQALFAIKASLHSSPSPSGPRLQSASPQGAGHTYDLTAREKEVLRLVSKGLSNKEIAANLTLSQETVKTHVKKILEKLNVDRRGKAVAVANTLGLLQEDNSTYY